MRIRHSQKSTLIVISIVILCLAWIASSSYRGMGHDEGLGSFRKGGLRIVEGQALFDREAGIGDAKDPARLVYIAFIALGYKLVGFNLTALHLFPYLFQIVNPWLFFLLIYYFYRSVWWGLAGALLFIAHPFTMIYLNQQHNHPFFVFLLIVISLVFHYAVETPKFLALFGCLTSLLILTRFEDGAFFAIILYGTYFLYRRKIGIPWTWLFISISVLIFTHGICALLFDFPISYPLHYFSELLQRQAEYGSRYSYFQATKRVLQYYLYWYFGGKFIAPFLVLFLVAGIVESWRTGRFYPVAIFLPYFLFLVFVYNGRFEIINLPVTTFTVPGFLLLLLSGIRVIGNLVDRTTQRVMQNHRRFLETQRRTLVLRRVANVLTIAIVLGFFLRSAYALAIIVEDSQPASTMWRIVKYNPPLPGNPLYKETYVQLNREERFAVRLREELFRAVRGNYRSWFLHTIGKYASKHDLPEKAIQQADFSYSDDYESKTRWEQDRFAFEGSSPLWNKKYRGRLGAFPYGKSGEFIYKFDFPQSIDDVTIHDIHMQWGFGDVTKMWTSPDGERWTLRYDNWNVRNTKDHYYQFFDDEFEGATSLFIKYYLHAGDRRRTGYDNRGASLEEFSVAVRYKRK